MKKTLLPFIITSLFTIFLTEMRAQLESTESHTLFIPEISLIGNNEEIPDGDSVPSTKNNTHFGNVGLTQSKTNEFLISNSGPAGLVISDINFTGVNANEYTLVEVPSYPLTIGQDKDFSIHVMFTPKEGGTRSATINIINNDLDEGVYDVRLEAEATFTTAIESIGSVVSGLIVYPNPAKDIATIELASEEEQAVSIHIFNLQGKEVQSPIVTTFSKGKQRVNIATTDWDNGIYYATIQSSKVEGTAKVAVVH